MRRRLVRHRVGVSEVFDRNGPAGLRILQGGHHVGLGNQQRPGEIVRLDALAQELRIAARFGMPEDAAGQRLQHSRSRIALGRHTARQIEPPVREVGDTARGLRQIGRVVQGESEIGGDLGCGALRERSTRCLLYTSPSPRDRQKSRMPSSA